MGEQSFFPISPLMIVPETLGEFSIYIKRGNGFALYCKRGSVFTSRHMQRLHNNGISEVYIESSEKLNYEKYAKINLGSILSNDNLPYPERSKVFLTTSKTIIKKAFTTRLSSSGPVHDQFFSDLYSLIAKSLDFISIDQVIKNIGKLMSHDYETYTHSIHVFIFSIALLKNHYDKEKLTQIAMGALLHDIGKTLVPDNILNKPGKLTEEEFEEIKKHPLYGVSLCTNAPLSQEAYNVILYHHEKLEGSGYPSGLTAERIPQYVQAVTVSDIYDALISKRAYADRMEPFEALSLMKKEFVEVNKIDVKLFESLVSIFAT